MLNRVNRFLLFIAIGFFVYLIAGVAMIIFRWDKITSDIGAFLDSLTTNFISDAVFFGLVGVAGTLAQFYGEKGDVLPQRLRRVFANDSVSLPVIDFFENIAKSNSVYAELAEHDITILEYRADICAYRGEFHNKYRLRNAFGDVSYEADISVEVARDFTRPGASPAAVVTAVDLVGPGGTERFLPGPVAVENAGFRQVIHVTLPAQGEAVLEMRWWSLIDAKGDWDSGFSLKRFAERFIVRVQNRSQHVIRIARSLEGDDIDIDYGQTFLVQDERNVPPRTRAEFYWRAPKGFEVPQGIGDGQRNNDFLEFDKMLGEKPIESI